MLHPCHALSVQKIYYALETCGATRKHKFPLTRPKLVWDQLGTRILRLFLGRVRDKDFSPVWVGVFFTGVSYIYFQEFLDKVESNGNHIFPK